MTRLSRSAALLACSILVVACSSASDGSGSGNGSQTLPDCPVGTHDVNNQCVPSTLSQQIVDDDTAIALISSAGDIFNQNIAGKSLPNPNLTANCPVGGTVHITGTVGVDSTHNLTTVNLTYAMTGCKISSASPTAGVNVTLSLDGTMTYTGSWDSSMYQSVNYQGMGVTMSGTDQRTNYAASTISQMCDVGLTYSQNGPSGTTSGTICGRTATN